MRVSDVIDLRLDARHIKRRHFRPSSESWVPNPRLRSNPTRYRKRSSALRFQGPPKLLWNDEIERRSPSPKQLSRLGWISQANDRSAGCRVRRNGRKPS